MIRTIIQHACESPLGMVPKESLSNAEVIILIITATVKITSNN